MKIDTSKMQTPGKAEWERMLNYVADLHRRSVRPAVAPFPHPWEEIGPGYCYGPAFGHWDIVHAILDILPLDAEHARHQIENNLAGQQDNGLVPGVIYVREGKADWRAETGHPPVWPIAVQDYADEHGSDILPLAYKALVRQISWFEQERKATGNGFFYIDILSPTGESGVDEGIRFFETQPGSFACVDATSHVFAMYVRASRWGQALGEESSEYAEKADDLKSFIQEQLFVQDTDFFHDIWAVRDPSLRDLVAWIIPKNILSLVFSTLGVVQMPHKFNAARRHKFDKVQYRVINWAEYNESLRQRGDLTIWVSEEAQSVWSAPRRTSRGGQRRYSDLAIETCLMLRTAYHLGLRQTQGLMGSIGTLMGLDIRVPDYSTLSRRANGVSIAQVMRQAGSVPIHLVVDSTGLKIFGEGEWLAQKHNTKGIRRRWRKLHLGLDLASGAIGCAALTHDNVGDSTALPGLLDQLDAPVTGFLADGAYDGSSTRNLLRQRYGETLDVVIPPPKDAVIRPQSARDATVRDRHLGQIRSNGCMAWQTATGYNQRSRIETQMGRWKSVIGPKLKSRSFSRQITEVQLGRKVLNTMTALGRPVFERIS